jgi:hypothetical protein
MKTLTALLVVGLTVAGCRSEMELTQEQRAKLEPGVQRLLTDEEVPDTGYDVTIRPDGSKEYGLIVRGSNPDEIRAAGIKVVSTFGEIMTVRVTRSQIGSLARLASVRSVSQGRTSYPQ